MKSQTWLALILLILTSLSEFVAAQNYWCYNDGNYTTNSTYSNNLNILLSSLHSNMDDSGFYNASQGQAGTDQAYAMALCRADIQRESCRSCVQNATVELLKLCAERKHAILWRDDCVLRYSNVSFFGARSDFPVIMVWNTANVSSPDQFKESLRAVVDDLRVQAASGGSLMKVAAGNHTAPDFQTIYAMLQCTPDISEEDCTGCLIAAAQRIPLEGKRAATILMPSCNLRYDLDPFYNITRIQEARAAMSMAAPPPAPATAAVPPPSVATAPGHGDDNTTRTVIIIVAPVVGCLIAATCVGICLRKRTKKKAVETIPSHEEISATESLQYDFGKIRAATDDFSDANKLGEGGFGAVYKGKLENGKEIAVKRLSRRSGQGDLEFKNEVLLLAKLQHRYLVRLLGFALEGTERLLIYEFVQNASLDHFIFDRIKRFYIDWDKRYKIIGGIARGLLYLHEDSRFRIIHRDLKASNILLDREMNPKIADFGTARLFDQDESAGCTSKIVGTYGYMAPEYANHGQISVKTDVFSFGVLVLEIVSGRKNNSFGNGENLGDMLISFAWRNWREGTPTSIIDPVLMSGTASQADILRCIHIGLLCVQENATDRPTMASVLLMLNSFSTTLSVPSPPAFFMSNSSDFRISLEKEPTHSINSSENGASITKLHPR
ncbi:Cysteine-rich receptor-like protein kinase [Sesamum alatum]|uniref:Cysteine-rich receptor-like protein kinase n=1 Tax=Sesamum alatum TaxID=300844 RepID=A0AAE1Y4N3_9LAMI|nr:Cysteine-rich receptor-like protein kinase [Sesamum alatum]